MASNRIGRINEEIQRELSDLIRLAQGPARTDAAFHHPRRHHAGSALQQNLYQRPRRGKAERRPARAQIRGRLAPARARQQPAAALYARSWCSSWTTRSNTARTCSIFCRSSRRSRRTKRERQAMTRLETAQIAARARQLHHPDPSPPGRRHHRMRRGAVPGSARARKVGLGAQKPAADAEACAVCRRASDGYLPGGRDGHIGGHCVAEASAALMRRRFIWKNGILLCHRPPREPYDLSRPEARRAGQRRLRRDHLWSCCELLGVTLDAADGRRRCILPSRPTPAASNIPIPPRTPMPQRRTLIAAGAEVYPINKTFFDTKSFAPAAAGGAADRFHRALRRRNRRAVYDAEVASRRAPHLRGRRRLHLRLCPLD